VLSWNGLSVPAATPQAVIDTLVKGINDVLPDPTIQEKAKSLGMDMHGSTPAEMDKRMKDDIAKWGAVIEKAGIPKRD
jgi:tripartite-type tricarboxylate transporter receptor subunit TctC